MNNYTFPTLVFYFLQWLFDQQIICYIGIRKLMWLKWEVIDTISSSVFLNMESPCEQKKEYLAICSRCRFIGLIDTI